MAKQSGLGDNLYVAGYDFSGDIGAIDTIKGGAALFEQTGIDKSAKERIGGLLGGELVFTAFFNPSANRSHKRLSTLPTTDQPVTYCRSTVLGKPSASVIAKQINYDGKRSDKGEIKFSIQALTTAAVPLEWGNQLTAGKRTDGSATNGTGVDFLASTTFGLAAYLHVFAFTGTSVVVKLQESSDNAVGDPYADTTGGAFTAATGITSQRIATATNQTVKRWLRVATTGTFSNAQFAVSVVRYLLAHS